MIQSPAGLEWREEVIAALERMVCTLAPKLDALGDPRLQWPLWQRFMQEHAAAWRQHVRTFLRVVEPAPEAPALKPPEVWKCHCDKAFKSSKALHAHQAKVHGTERPSSKFVRDGRCPFCGANFVTRRRAMHHVEYGARRCREALAASQHLPGLASDELAAARATDRRDYQAAKEQGVWRNAGPPATPPAGGWRRPRQVRSEGR